MGHRANYVIIEHGQVQIFYSQWGALSVPAVMLSGPAATLDSVRDNKAVDGLMVTAWAEGGILLDVDARHALFWGGESAVYDYAYVRRPLLKLLSVLWEGWSVEWATFDQADFARYIGLDDTEIERLLKGPGDDTNVWLTSDEPLRTEEELLAEINTDKYWGVLTIRRKSGKIDDYLLKCGTYTALSFGPRLLSILASRSGVPLPKETDQESGLLGNKVVFRGAYLDEAARTIWVWESCSIDPRDLKAIVRRWPGWPVRGHVEGLVRHVLLSGRDPAPLQVPKQQAIQELIEELMQGSRFDPLDIARNIYQELSPEEQQTLGFGRSFFKKGTPPLTLQELQEILKRQ